MNSGSVWRLLCIGLLCTLAISSTCGASESVPTESECRPHIEKALNIIKGDLKEPDSAEITVDVDDSKEKADDEQIAVTVDDDDDGDATDGNGDEEIEPNTSNEQNDDDNSKESTNEADSKEDDAADDDEPSKENQESGEQADEPAAEDSKEADTDSKEESDNEADAKEDEASVENDSKEVEADADDSQEEQAAEPVDESVEKTDAQESQAAPDTDDSGEKTEQDDEQSNEEEDKKVEDDDSQEDAAKAEDPASKEDDSENASKEDDNNDEASTEKDDDKDDSKETDKDADDSKESDKDDESQEEQQTTNDVAESHEISAKSFPVDDLLLESGIPENLRDRSHIDEILRLNEDSVAQNEALQKIADKTLNELKKVYENAIKPLETMYKYRDLSNRHFGDPEIFSKPLVLMMGPWSGGKSSIINYLTDNEYTDFSLKTGAEPSLPYFNILTHGETEQVLDGTQLAADWTFSGLQKFGQGLQDRLRGLKLPSKLLEKVNIVEIPGILEVRKHVSRIFSFNDACQWFIDRADIIFLTYDPSKLDVGPETEAILDQLKGREYQTRIVLNKADQVHPEELLRVQSALIWNISPLMSSQQPPVMYTVSLWSHPFEENTPVRLLQAQEKALLQDLAQAIDHRIENKIASARRFAVRVRNHAKMVDCYLTTYYNHKTLFGNKKKISGEIVSHPQNYHIYEGLSTLTNISRYDLPDPDVYREFFQLNPLYEFKKLSETCTYFRGCPINKLDVAIAYELPKLVNRYKRSVEQALNTLELGNANSDASTDRR